MISRVVSLNIQDHFVTIHNKCPTQRLSLMHQTTGAFSRFGPSEQKHRSESRSTTTTKKAYTLPVHPAAGGGAESENGVVGEVPGCA